MKVKLTEAEGSATRLQRALDQMLNDKVSKESLTPPPRFNARLGPELALTHSVISRRRSHAVRL